MILTEGVVPDETAMTSPHHFSLHQLKHHPLSASRILDPAPNAPGPPNLDAEPEPCPVCREGVLERRVIPSLDVGEALSPPGVWAGMEVEGVP